MTIDTDAERASALAYGTDDAFPWREPSADDFDQADLQHMLGAFRGILAGEVDEVLRRVCIAVDYTARQGMAADYAGQERLTVDMPGSCG